MSGETGVGSTRPREETSPTPGARAGEKKRTGPDEGAPKKDLSKAFSHRQRDNNSSSSQVELAGKRVKGDREQVHYGSEKSVRSQGGRVKRPSQIKDTRGPFCCRIGGKEKGGSRENLSRPDALVRRAKKEHIPGSGISLKSQRDSRRRSTERKGDRDRRGFLKKIQRRERGQYQLFRTTIHSLLTPSQRTEVAEREEAGGM